MKNEMMQKAANALTKFSAKAKAHSPEILLIAGIAGAVPGGYPPFLPGGLLHPGDQSNSGAKRGNDPL